MALVPGKANRRAEMLRHRRKCLVEATESDQPSAKDPDQQQRKEKAYAKCRSECPPVRGFESIGQDCESDEWENDFERVV
jgi:hypothetical protein